MDAMHRVAVDSRAHDGRRGLAFEIHDSRKATQYDDESHRDARVYVCIEVVAQERSLARRSQASRRLLHFVRLSSVLLISGRSPGGRLSVPEL